MSAQDEVREMTPELASDTDADREEYLVELFGDLPYAHRERMAHDGDAYFAELAGSEKCLALGHAWNEDEEMHFPDRDHGSGWDVEELCFMTKYGTACTMCEGECDWNFGQIPNLWEMVATKGKS